MRVLVLYGKVYLLTELLRADVYGADHAAVTKLVHKGDILLVGNIVKARHKNLVIASVKVGNEVVCDEEVFKRNVTHTVAYARDLCVLGEKPHKVIVATAAEHSAVVFGRFVKDLENSTRVIVKTADYTEVKHAVFEKPCFLKRVKERDKLLRANRIGAKGSRLFHAHRVERIYFFNLLSAYAKLAHVLDVSLTSDLVLAVNHL